MEIFSAYKEIDRIERFLSNFAQEAILIIKNPDGTSIKIQPNCKIISAQPIYSETEANSIDEELTNNNKVKKMQELFGTVEDKMCKTCDYCIKSPQSRTHYKCKLAIELFKGKSYTTSIQLKHQACKKYKERKRNEG